MLLTADLTGKGEALRNVRVLDARRRQRLGEPAHCTFELALADRRLDLDRLAALIEAGEAMIQARGPEGAAFAAPLRIERISVEPALDETRRVRIEAAPPPCDTTLRRRVHHPRSLLDLVKHFARIAHVPTVVANVLSRVELPDGEHTSIVQDGESDGDFLRRVLAQHDFLQTETALHGLLLTGIFAEKGKPTWRLGWGHEQAYRHLNQVDARLVDIPANEGVADIDFGTAGAGATVIRKRLGRPFSVSPWASWLKRDLPGFLKEGQRMIGAFEDRLHVTHAGKIAWDSHCEVWPRGTGVDPEAVIPARTWVGLGVVVGWQDGWLRVRLPGFDAKEEGDIVQARLETPYSGTTGEQGLHLVPEPNTTVLLGWSGWFRDSIVVLGNVRDRTVQLAEPSLWLEFPTRFRFRELTVEVEGLHRLAVRGDFAVEGESKISLRSKREMGFEGDGGKAALKGGAWKAGQGA